MLHRAGSLGSVWRRRRYPRPRLARAREVSVSKPGDWCMWYARTYAPGETPASFANRQAGGQPMVAGAAHSLGGPAAAPPLR